MSGCDYLFLPKGGYPSWEAELFTADAIFDHLCDLRRKYDMDDLLRDGVIDRSALDYLERVLAQGVTKTHFVTNRAHINVGLIRTEPDIDVFLGGTDAVRIHNESKSCGIASKSFLWGTLAVLEVETYGRERKGVTEVKATA